MEDPTSAEVQRAEGNNDTTTTPAAPLHGVVYFIETVGNVSMG